MMTTAAAATRGVGRRRLASQAMTFLLPALGMTVAFRWEA
jgi:hypothetical protein